MPIIRISGDIGSGKTTLAKRLAARLHYEYANTGAILREMAREQGLSIEEFYAALVDDPNREKSVDARQEELMCRENNLVVDGRVAPFLKSAFPAVNVKIAVSAEEGARRLLARAEYAGKTEAEVMALARERVARERERYRALYGIDDHLADRKFHIVLNTTLLNEEQAFVVLVKEIAPRL